MRVAHSAKRMLTIYTYDLEPQIYDQPPFLDILKRAVLSQRFFKVRVLVSEPSRVVYDNNRFVMMARRLTTHIEIRHVEERLRGNPSSFMIADDRATLLRLQYSRWDGMCEMADAGVARTYLDYFDGLWTAGPQAREAREVRL